MIVPSSSVSGLSCALRDAFRSPCRRAKRADMGTGVQRLRKLVSIRMMPGVDGTCQSRSRPDASSVVGKGDPSCEFSVDPFSVCPFFGRSLAASRYGLAQNGQTENSQL